MLQYIDNINRFIKVFRSFLTSFPLFVLTLEDVVVDAADAGKVVADVKDVETVDLEAVF